MKKIEDLTKIISQNITGEEVMDAVKKSGFPLQTLIADQLSTEFYVQEEWAFRDSDSQETRTLDILAQRAFWLKEKKQPYTRPVLNLLIECKKSESPYVFFLSPNQSQVTDFPVISGLHQDTIALKTDDDRSTYNYPIMHCLGLDSHPFLSHTIPSAMTFSKAVRNGKKVELKGDEPFNSLVLPLVKAVRHFKETSTPPNTARYFDCGVTLGVAVIDAPLLGVSSKNNEIVSLNWVRVFRRTSEEEFQHRFDRFKCFAIDVVQKDFLDAYLNKNVMPFMELFNKLVIKHQREINTGKGFARGVGKGSLKIESTLKPR